MTKSELLQILEKLTPVQFNKLESTLDVSSVLPSSENTSQTARAISLLSLAEAPGGIGLERLEKVLEELIGITGEAKDTISNSQIEGGQNSPSYQYSNSEAQNPEDKTESKESQIDTYVKRAEDYKQIEKYSEAIVELENALKIEPNNSSCHGLLGLVYLEQNNMSMAKFHIDKAWERDPHDHKIKEAKKKLDKNKKNS